jgi:hypothetical protein
MSKLTFEELVVQAAQNAVVALLSKGDWLKLEYADKVPISQADLRGIYAKVDMERVKALVLDKVEERIADTIIGNMAKELGTDVKQIMCNTELREDLRGMLRAKIRESKTALKE